MADGPPDDMCQLWLGIVTDSWLLGAEAAMVVPLRLARLAQGGPSAAAEARRMVAEKVSANRKLARDIASGQYGRRPDRIAAGSLHFYLARVRANRKRLMRKCS